VGVGNSCWCNLGPTARSSNAHPLLFQPEYPNIPATPILCFPFSVHNEFAAGRRPALAPKESRTLSHTLAVEAILAHRDAKRVGCSEGGCVQCRKAL